MTDWNWPGSRWWRVDLHTHSPASLDFAPRSDREARDWQAWVKNAEQAELHAVALTDHNTPEGITGIKEAAANSTLVVFPGVELSVSGIHLLCIFDPSRGRDDVLGLLTLCDIKPEEFGNCETHSTKGICDAIEAANRKDAIVIGAHVNAPKGLLTTLAGELWHKALQAPGLAAVELAEMPKDPERAKEYMDPGSEEVAHLLDGSRWNGPPLTRVFGSDSHAHDQAGRCFTWVKMTTPDAEGLRLALIDGEGSVKSSDCSEPNRHASRVVESIRVSQAKYMGLFRKICG